MRPAELIASVAAWHGLTHGDIVGRSRVSEIVTARFDAIVAVHLNCRNGDNLSHIGRCFNRDHTTILHALRKRGYCIKRKWRRKVTYFPAPHDPMIMVALVELPDGTAVRGVSFNRGRNARHNAYGDAYRAIIRASSPASGSSIA